MRLAVSWMCFLVPLTLLGHSPFMRAFGLVLPTEDTGRRILFSALHTLSVLLVPISFMCLVLSARHHSLGEMLSGQELLPLPSPSRG